MSTAAAWLTRWVPMGRGSCVRRLLLNILRAGPIPKHVALIMDGNRRYARKSGVPSSLGHAAGFEKLEEILELCLELGVKTVTVYAFSIDNFKRNDEEVSALMKLAEEKLYRLMNEVESIKKHEVGIRVLGAVELLPEGVRRAVGKAVTMTRKHERCVLNVCMPYTARHEMLQATRDLAAGVDAQILQPDDVDEALFERCLFTRGGQPDLVVRTSGVVRLSDFLLWQSSFSALYFSQALWPEFSFLDMFAAVIFYQRNHAAVQAQRASNDAFCASTRSASGERRDATRRRKSRVERFVTWLDTRRDSLFEFYAEQ